MSGPVTTLGLYSDTDRPCRFTERHLNNVILKGSTSYVTKQEYPNVCKTTVSNGRDGRREDGRGDKDLKVIISSTLKKKVRMGTVKLPTRVPVNDKS